MANLWEEGTNVGKCGKSKQPRQKMGRSWQGRMKRARLQNIDRLWGLLTENQTSTAIARNMATISAHFLPKKNCYETGTLSGADSFKMSQYSPRF
jgi:hypothetical protein